MNKRDGIKLFCWTVHCVVDSHTRFQSQSSLAWLSSARTDESGKEREEHKYKWFLIYLVATSLDFDSKVSADDILEFWQNYGWRLGRCIGCVVRRYVLPAKRMSPDETTMIEQASERSKLLGQGSHGQWNIEFNGYPATNWFQ